MQARHDRFDDTVPDRKWPERLFMLSPALQCIAGEDGFFKHVNPAFEQKLGHTTTTLMAQPFIEFVHPDDRQSTLDEVGRLSTGIPTVHFENRYRHANGSYRWLLWNAIPVAEEGLLYATAIDITTRKHADERYRNLLNSVPDSIIFIDRQGKILEFNHATESLFGYAAAELVGQSIEVLVPERFDDWREQHGEGSTKDSQPRLMGSKQRDFVAVRKDGSEFPIEVSFAPVEREHFICVARDISPRRQHEHELAESQALLMEEQEQLRGLSTRLLLAEESERYRIARGLHDDVGQTLLAAKLSLEDLLAGGVSGETVSTAQEIHDYVDQAIETTRSLTFELASAALYEVGVGAALQSECELAEQQSGIRFQPPDQLTGQNIPMHVKIIVHRVGRELIRNVIKHSGAQSATISLSLSPNESTLQLTVADDGRGFKVSKGLYNSDPTTGFGLFSIEQQLDSIGGMIDIASSEEYGTRVVVTVVLDGSQVRQ